VEREVICRLLGFRNAENLSGQRHLLVGSSFSFQAENPPAMSVTAVKPAEQSSDAAMRDLLPLWHPTMISSSFPKVVDTFSRKCVFFVSPEPVLYIYGMFTAPTGCPPANSPSVLQRSSTTIKLQKFHRKTAA
jgi:hypothetical protein